MVYHGGKGPQGSPSLDAPAAPCPLPARGCFAVQGERAAGKDALSYGNSGQMGGPYHQPRWQSPGSAARRPLSLFLPGVPGGGPGGAGRGAGGGSRGVPRAAQRGGDGTGFPQPRLGGVFQADSRPSLRSHRTAQAGSQRRRGDPGRRLVCRTDRHLWARPVRRLSPGAVAAPDHYLRGRPDTDVGQR